MDAGLVGGLIGIGVMVCAICLGVAYEKGGVVVKKVKEKLQSYKNQRQPLLPVTKTNPVLVRLPSKQFQMKELVRK